jgi:formate/nitrite transporter FocA (FNT family)
VREAMLEISRKAADHGWWALLAKGIPAGFLIAAIVWIAPNAEGAKFHIIAVLTYLIAAAGFAHIVAGAVESSMLVLAGEMGALRALTHFGVPVLIGNVVGGTALFTAIAYAQVKAEV